VGEADSAGDREPVHRLLKRIRAEYLEMPGLRLKLEQIQRLCGMDRSMCQVVLESLVNAKFLGVSPDGYYVLQHPDRQR
jgi:DNA-binding IclR family transcriptional regulator